MNELHAIATIAYRDWVKLIRDRPRIMATFIFPLLFVGVLGASLQSNLGSDAGYNFLAFVFTGVLGQTLFQSTAAGLISLVEDRENDFSQEVFVAPISRYSIIFGKIAGETLVALTQIVGIVLFGFVIGIPFSAIQLVRFIPVAIIVCLLGGAFGLVVMTNLKSQRAANQIFPFVIFPQFFLAGVFSPIKELPWYLHIFSRIAPMTYAVDLTRNAYYSGLSEYDKTVLFPVHINLLIIGATFVVCFVAGTYLFVRNERNK